MERGGLECSVEGWEKRVKLQGVSCRARAADEEDGGEGLECRCPCLLQVAVTLQCGLGTRQRLHGESRPRAAYREASGPSSTMRCER